VKKKGVSLPPDRPFQTSFFVGVAVNSSAAHEGQVRLSADLLRNFREFLQTSYKDFVDGMDVAVGLSAWRDLPSVVWQWRFPDAPDPAAKAVAERRSVLQRMRDDRIFGVARAVAHCEGQIKGVSEAEIRSSLLYNASVAIGPVHGVDAEKLRAVTSVLLPSPADEVEAPHTTLLQPSTSSSLLRRDVVVSVNSLPGFDDDDAAVVVSRFDTASAPAPAPPPPVAISASAVAAVIAATEPVVAPTSTPDPPVPVPAPDRVEAAGTKRPPPAADSPWSARSRAPRGCAGSSRAAAA
jgi:hypothetical protein